MTDGGVKQRLALGLAVIAALAGLGVGCGETDACEEAEQKGHGTHACYLENRELERETHKNEAELNGESLEQFEAGEEADERREFREAYEEAEKEAEFWGE